MKAHKKRILWSAAFFVGIIMFFGTGIKCDTAAASTTKKYQKAYQEFLSAEKIPWGGKKINTKNLYYLLYDVDHNGIPELFLKNPKAEGQENSVQLYTFSRKKNKVKLLYETSSRIYVYENQSLICFVGEMTGLNFTNYCTLKGSRMEKKLSMTGTIIKEMLLPGTEVLEVAPGKADTIYFYFFKAGEEVIDRDEAELLVRGMEKDNKVISIGTYQKNTKKNRNQI